MEFFYLILGGRATYRLSLLFSREDGPAFLFSKLRKLPSSKSSLKHGLSCEWCVSIWMGALVSMYLFWLQIVPGAEWPLYWLAMSAISIICNQQWTKSS